MFYKLFALCGKIRENKDTMAKKWNFKSWFSSLVEKLRRSKSEETPFYLPNEDSPKKPKKSDENVSSEFNLSQAIFGVNSRHKVHQIFIGTFIFSLCFFTGKLLGYLLTPSSINMNTAKPAATIAASGASPMEIRNNINNLRDSDPFKTRIRTEGEVAQEDVNKKCEDADKKSTLPIKLVNTIVLQDSIKSLASVEVRSEKDLQNIREGDDVSSMARIAKIERLRIILKNLQNGQCEYISHEKIEEEQNIKSPRIFTDTESKVFKEEKQQELDGIKQDGNKISVSRKLINEKMKNYMQILQDARAVQINNPDGSLAFKIVDITPGSLYTFLNIKNEDVIKSINGKPIQNVNEVMMLFGKIGTMSKLNLEIERDGNTIPLTYEFTN